MRSELEETLVDWNLDYPFDRWYRQKYNIPFNSINHRNISHVDMFFDYIEDLLFRKVEQEILKNIRDESQVYRPGSRNFLKEKDNDLTDEDFFNLDLSKIVL